MKRYQNIEEIEAVVGGFENATISRESWKHAEHLTVALYYVSRFDFETAVAKMRSGLFNLLREGFGVDLKVEMPYHETLTVFWMHTVADFHFRNKAFGIVDAANRLIEVYEKNYPLRFYDRERLFSDEARARYIEPGQERESQEDRLEN